LFQFNFGKKDKFFFCKTKRENKQKINSLEKLKTKEVKGKRKTVFISSFPSRSIH